jgi:hypothetical protein
MCAVEMAELERVIPSPLVSSSKKTDIMIAVDGNGAIPKIARAKDPNAGIWLSPDTVRQDSSRWSTKVDPGGEYALEFVNAGGGGAFSVYVGGKPMAVGTFGAGGELSDVTTSKKKKEEKFPKLWFVVPMAAK